MNVKAMSAVIKRSTKRRRPPILDGIAVLGLSLLAASAVFPVLFMAFNAFRTQADWDASKLGFPTTLSPVAFERAWTGANIPTYFWNSVTVVSGTVVLSLFLAAPASYAFAKIQWPGRSVAYLFTLSWMAIPSLLLIVPIYIEMVQLHLIDNKLSVILVYSALNLSFNVYLLTTFFRSLPNEVLESARIDRASVHRILWSIVLPMSRSAIATLVVFNALWAWNEFVFALILLQSDGSLTLTVGVLQLQGRFGTDYPALMAGLLITAVPMIGVYIFFQRYIVQAITAGAVK